MAHSLRCNNILRLCARRVPSLRFSSTTSDRKGLVLGVYTSDNNGIELTPAAEKYNQVSDGKLVEQIALAGNKVKAGKSFVFWGLDEDHPAIAVVGLGKRNEKIDECELICQEKESVRIAAFAGCRALDSSGIKTIYIEDLCDAESAAEGSHLGTWKFQEYKTTGREPLPTVKPYNFDEESLRSWSRGVVRADAQNLARRLADTPSNLLTPSIFAEEIQKAMVGCKATVMVHDENWAKEQRMCSFLSVAKGSVEPPKFVEIAYDKGDKGDAPYVLIGKGVTFDSGGISLKPSAKMDEMRGDMGGAAAVVGCLYGVATLGIEANLRVLLPLVENMPSGSATKPGDVFTARNGKTICVDNTDAEGRLILADALSYSEEFRPEWVLDVATLTGAIGVALGNAATGVYTNSNRLYSILESSGSRTGDRVWRMPLWKHYTKQMNQHEAYDLNNISKGGKGGGSCTAAAFLREFVPEKTDWLHLDIAGVMGPQDDTPYLQKGMSGRPTRTLIDFLEAQVKRCREG